MKRILIATDGSDASAAAIEEGLELAQALEAEVTFVYVKSPPASFIGEPYYRNAVHREVELAGEAIAHAMERAEAYGVDAMSEVFEGDPAEHILRLGMSLDADLIVLGSRGLGAFKGALLGSVSRAVVRGADRPVLVAPTGSRTPAPLVR